MDILARFLLALSLVVLSSAQRVLFVNGDQLSGHLSRVDSEGNFYWQAEVAQQAIRLNPEFLHTLDLTGGEREPAQKEGFVAEVILNRGDHFIGTVVDLSPQHLVLSTSYGGELSLDSGMIDQVRLYDWEEIVFRGPGELNNWKQIGAGTNWEKKNESLVSNGRGALSQRVGNLRRGHLRFRLEWLNYPRFKIFLNASGGQGYEPNSYFEIGVNRRSLIARYKNNGDTINIGQKHNLKLLAEQEMAQFDLYYDSSTVIVHLEGEEVARWVLPEAMQALRGEWMYLNAESSESVVVSELELRRWNGTEQVKPEEEPSRKSAAPEQLLVLQNGDPLTGTITKFEKEILTIQTAFGETQLPLQRVRELHYSHQPYQEAKRNRGDLKLYFYDGAEATIQVQRWENEQITGTSQNFGEASFSLRAVRQIRFNLYSE